MSPKLKPGRINGMLGRGAQRHALKHKPFKVASDGLNEAITLLISKIISLAKFVKRQIQQGWRRS